MSVVDDGRHVHNIIYLYSTVGRCRYIYIYIRYNNIIYSATCVCVQRARVYSYYNNIYMYIYVRRTLVGGLLLLYRCAYYYYCNVLYYYYYGRAHPCRLRSATAPPPSLWRYDFSAMLANRRVIGTPISQ